MNPKKPKIFETTFAVFTATDIVGQGGSGRVYKAIDDTGTVRDRYRGEVARPIKSQ